METTPPTGDDLAEHLRNAQAERLAAVFGAYKDEWLDKDVFGYFEEPQYWPDLSGPRPCVLEGGRGTGKTTVLRGMSYDGQFARAELRSEAIGAWSYFGVYHKIDTGRVTAMRGEELAEEQWIRLFSHYFNLVLCGSICELLIWLEGHGFEVALPAASWLAVANTLNVPEAGDHRQLAERIERGLDDFESYVNNVADGGGPRLSMRGAPVERLISVLRATPGFAGRSFFFLLDEYENLEPYQQRVVNTLIKHAKEGWTFKVGVRELGWEETSTLRDSEWLEDPADYRRISITSRFDEDAFRHFAAQVCDKRLSRLWKDLEEMDAHPASPPDVELLLPGMSDDEEAVALGVERQIEGVPGILAAAAEEVGLAPPPELSPLRQYLIKHWAETHPNDGTLEDVARDFVLNERVWHDRYGNYERQALFSLKAGKPGIRKYYAGWDVLCRLAGSNIRYLLQLVEQGLLLGLEAGGRLGDPIDVRQQTSAARAVAEKNLRQLEGRSSDGAQLQRLALGLGRIFAALAERGAAGAPEVDQFQLAEGSIEAKSEERLERLLRQAVMTLALVRERSNKPQSESELRGGDLYSLHPLFSAYFVYSYRRKRKMKLPGQVLLGLIDEPRRTLQAVLGADGLGSEAAEGDDDDPQAQIPMFDDSDDSA